MEYGGKELPIYVYGIIKTAEQQKFGNIGIGGKQPVFTLHNKELAAVCSRCEQSSFDPTKENVMAHTQVISTVMQNFTIIPMSFGMVFKNAKLVSNFLNETYIGLYKVYQKIEGKVELGLKAYFRKEVWESELERLANQDREIVQMKKNYQQAGSYDTMLRIGEAVEQKIAGLKEKYTIKIYDRLAALSVGAKLNDLMGERMLLNAAFLVEKEKVEAMDLEVEKIAAETAELFEFNYTGPWPAYNFINIRIKTK